MDANGAIADRLLPLCKEREISSNTHDGSTGVSPLHGIQHTQHQKQGSRYGFPAKALQWIDNHFAGVFQ